jgi:hypothetical protein
MGERFVDWGYPSWFRLVVGAGELVGGALLSPRRRFLGAGLLVVILVGATLTHVVNGDPLSESVSAPLHLVLAATVAWATRPDRYGSASSAASSATTASPPAAGAGARVAARSAQVRAGSKP